jgi:hypothetical protein
MVVPLSDEQRAVHIPRLVEDLTVRLSKSSAAMNDCYAIFSAAAVAHGKLRYLQGYAPAMLVDESRILEVTIFGMLQSNRHSLDVTPAVARCHGYRGRGGCAVDPVSWRLQRNS